MTKTEAKALGFDAGYGIARENFDEFYQVWSKDVTGPLNDRPISDSDKNSLIEYVVSGSLETESEHYRQFSPFEFTAQVFNDSSDPEGMWAAYEAGVYSGANKAAKEEFLRNFSKVTGWMRND